MKIKYVTLQFSVEKPVAITFAQENPATKEDDFLDEKTLRRVMVDVQQCFENTLKAGNIT